MTYIGRHDVDAERSARALTEIERRIGATIAELPHRTAALSELMTDALGLLGHRSVLDPAGDIWDAACFAADVGAAIFIVACAEPGRTVHIELRKRRIPVTATGPVSFASGSTWLTANYLAHITRDEPKMYLLGEVPLDVLRASGIEEPEYVFQLCHLYQGYILGELNDALAAALKATAPGAFNLRHRVHVRAFTMPQLNFFQAISGGGCYTELFVDALEQHKDFWSTEDNRENPEGFVAIGALALRGSAHDCGTPVDVRSDYLPESLFSRPWPDDEEDEDEW